MNSVVASTALQSEDALLPHSRTPTLSGKQRQLLLALQDAIGLTLLVILVGTIFPGPGRVLVIYFLVLPPWLLFGHVMGLYDLRIILAPRLAMTALGRTAVAVGCVLGLLFFLTPFDVSRPKTLVLALSAPLVVGCGRLVTSRVLGSKSLERRILIVGTETAQSLLTRAVGAFDGHGITVVGTVDPAVAVAGENSNAGDATADRLWRLARIHGSSEIVLAVEGPLPAVLADQLLDCYERGAILTSLPSIYEEITGQLPVELITGHSIEALTVESSVRGLYPFVKRCLDLLLGGTLLVLTAPLMLFVACLIRIFMGSPVLYRQTRVGLGGNPFTIVKFRSMTVDAESDGNAAWAANSDPRVTPLGRWLRRLHIDELPQLWLIVAGTMSLVGPRPERPEFVSHLERDLPLYKARHRVRPGLTGWAQVNQQYADSHESSLTKLRYDLYYIKHSSVHLDALILMRTFYQVVAFAGR